MSAPTLQKRTAVSLLGALSLPRACAYLRAAAASWGRAVLLASALLASGAAILLSIAPVVSWPLLLYPPAAIAA